LPFVGLLAFASVVPHSALAADGEPSCLAKLRARLPGAVTTTTLNARTLGSKRLRFRRGGVVLVIDLAVLESTTKKFLKDNGADRFPEEVNVLRRFAQALRGHLGTGCRRATPSCGSTTATTAAPSVARAAASFSPLGAMSWLR